MAAEPLVELRQLLIGIAFQREVARARPPSSRARCRCASAADQVARLARDDAVDLFGFAVGARVAEVRRQLHGVVAPALRFAEVATFRFQQRTFTSSWMRIESPPSALAMVSASENAASASS